VGFLGRVSLAAIAFVSCAAAGWTQEGSECPSGPATPAVDPALYAELVGWIALNTSYDVSRTWHDPPEMAFCSVGETIDYEGGELHVDRALRAVYDLSLRRITMALPWSPDHLVDRSILLHELIHDVQHQNREWPCIGAPEWEAYRLQDKWLQEHGALLPFDWAMIRRLSQCPATVP
jgi:hypothetical protein